MSATRRDLLLAAGGLAMGCAAGLPRSPGGARRIRAVALDAFVLFDPRPFTRALEASFPGRGAALAATYRARLFEYGWLRALGGRYQDFWRVSADASTPPRRPSDSTSHRRCAPRSSTSGAHSRRGPTPSRACGSCRAGGCSWQCCPTGRRR